MDTIGKANTIRNAANAIHAAADMLRLAMPAASAIEARAVMAIIERARAAADSADQLAGDMLDGITFESKGERFAFADALLATAADDGLCNWLHWAKVGESMAGWTRVS